MIFFISSCHNMCYILSSGPTDEAIKNHKTVKSSNILRGPLGIAHFDHNMYSFYNKLYCCYPLETSYLGKLKY